MNKLTTILASLIVTLAMAGEASAYTVKSGDTMGKIAKSNNLTLSELVKLNPEVSDPNRIYVGQHINTEASEVATTGISQADKELMARLIRAEAVGEPYAGKVAVGTVVLNRVDSPDFPNTIREVIYQDRQFTPVANGEINKAYDSESMRAVEEAISFRGQGSGSLFFYNPTTATSRWLDSRPTTVVIGNHVFKK